MKPDTRVAIIINRSDSVCSACNKNADPHETAHLNENMAGPGCGAVYEVVSSNYAGLEEVTQAFRPDLPFVSYFERVGAVK